MMIIYIAITTLAVFFVGMGLKVTSKADANGKSPAKAPLIYTGVERRAKKRYEPIF
jgi:hypothetical protein